MQVGPSVQVLEGVRRGPYATNPVTAHFIVSNTGTLIYIPGPVATAARARNLALIDRDGDVQRLKVPPRPYEFPRFSPDGKRVAVEIDERNEFAVWTLDLNGISPPRRLTLTGKNRFPIWNADGDRLAFQSDREGDLGICWQRADGAGMTERLTKAEPGEVHIPNSWSPVDRDTFLFTVRKGDNYSLWAYSRKLRKAAPFGDVVSSAAPDGNFSRDGRWVEYSTGRGAASRIFLQPFPSTGETHEISSDSIAAWSADGKGLFILDPVAITFVSITTGPTLTIGNPVPVPRRASMGAGFAEPRNWDISPLDNRLLGVVDAEELEPQIRVVLNWFTELQQRVPVK